MLVWWPQSRLLRILLGGAWAAVGADAVAEESAWQAAQSVLQERCTKCHGGVKRKGGVDLRAEASILRGGDSGPIVVAGSPEESLLMEVLSEDADSPMPPKGEGLTEAEEAALRQWVEVLGRPESPASVSELPASGLSPELVIDFQLAQGWQERDLSPADPLGDAGFVRRAYLHLMGRIPTLREREAFLTKTDSGKRDELVEDLLSSEGFAAHFAEVFNTVFLGREHGLVGRERPLERGDDWHRYLHWIFATNRPWNEVARDLLLPSSERSESVEVRGARWFLAAHRDKHEDIAKRVAPILLGKQIACAQCHDHPLVPEIEQRHYWGMVAFFNRSFNVDTPQGMVTGESALGGDIKFSSLEGESHAALLSFFDGTTVDEPSGRDGELKETAELYDIAPSEEFFERVAKTEEDPKKKKKKGMMKMEAAPIPQFSRREALAEIALETYPDFAEAMVNRIWAILFGRGLVHPVDHLDSVHPASHPLLLEWLGRDFAEHGFDVKRLIGGMMRSRAYQLASEPPGQLRPPEESFACGLVQPLSAEVLYRSMLVAGGHQPDLGGIAFDGIDSSTYLEAFARIYPDLFPEVYQPRVAEGMFVSNNPLLGEVVVREWEGRTPEQVVDEVFLAALGREPDDAEREKSLAYLAGGSDRLAERGRSLLWALIAGSEFRFNH